MVDMMNYLHCLAPKDARIDVLLLSEGVGLNIVTPDETGDNFNNYVEISTEEARRLCDLLLTWINIKGVD